MHQTKKGNHWHFSMNVHIGVDGDSELVYTVVSAAANVNDLTKASKYVNGAEAYVLPDASFIDSISILIKALYLN
jgi:IS5 family transposase